MIQLILLILFAIACIGAGGAVLETLGTCIIGFVIICIIIVLKKEKTESQNKKYGEHPSYILLRCPDCGALTVSADIRSKTDARPWITPKEALDIVGEEALEEIDMIDEDEDIEDCVYCGKCERFFNPNDAI